MKKQIFINRHKNLFLSVLVFCIIAISVSVTTSALSSEIVYDNTSTGLGYYSPANVEYGDQITLGGTNRWIGDFKFAYTVYSANFINGDETAQIRFYANDGSNGSPGTLLYNSGTFALPPTAGNNSYTLSHLSILVPDTITWTVLFGGIALNEAANAGGLQFFDPPTIGSSDPSFFWAKEDAGFVKITAHTGTGEIVPNNFNAQLTANPVPAPPTLLLLGSGLLGLGGWRKFRKN